jgi:WD40 repeat protein/uncharacterized caspase-like protein
VSVMLRRFRLCAAWSALLLAFTTAQCLGQDAPIQGALAKPELVLQASHLGTVSGVAFSPDSKLLVTVGFDGVAKLWDTSERHELRTIDARTTLSNVQVSARLYAVTYSPDGSAFAVASDHRVVLWMLSNPASQTQPGDLRHIISESNEGWITDLAFDPTGRWIVSASTDNLVRIWDSKDLHLVRTLTGHSGPVLAVAFSPDGTRIASGGVDESLIIWDANSGEKLSEFRGHTDWLRVLAFSPDGRVIASGSDDKTIKIWSTISGETLNTLSMKSEVDGVAFSPDGHYLASGGDDGVVELWEYESALSIHRVGDASMAIVEELGAGKILTTTRRESFPFGQNRRMIAWSSGRITFSPDGRLLVRGGTDIVNVWLVPTLTLFNTLGRHIRVGTSEFSPRGDSLAVSSTHDLKQWDFALGRVQKRITSPSFEIMESFELSPNGDYLACAFQSGQIQVFNATTWRRIANISPISNECPSGNCFIKNLRFSQDGNLLASASQNNVFDIWNPLTGAKLLTLNTEPQKGNSSHSVAFRSDGQSLVTAGMTEKTISIWDLSNGQRLADLETGFGTFVLAVDNNSGSLVAGGNFGVTLWAGEDWKQSRKFYGHQAWVHGASFSSDGRLLATGSADNTVRIWDVATAKEFSRLVGYPISPSFSRDSRWLASGNGSEIALWDVRTGEMKANLISFGRSDWLVTTPDGLFDGSPGAWTTLMWRFNSSNVFDVLPVEAFFSEFYRPGLLTDIFTRANVDPPETIATIDRRQPQLKLSSPDADKHGPTASRTVSLDLDIEQVPAGGNNSYPSGARDVRVFRNGSLVKVFHGEVGSADLQLQVPIIAGPNVFTAYAFNDANVKSRDARLRVVGADSLKRKGTAYIIAVGVNKYADPNYNLRYAAQDAQAFSEELRKQQLQLDTFSRVEVVPLIDGDATKANVLGTLYQLTGHASLSETAPESVRSLHRAEPEDVVFVYFAGHGTSVKSHFYLIPYDLGYQGKRNELNEERLNAILEHSISDEELRKGFEGIDAGKIVLVIDACNSGQALEAEEKRRGPMNSKGLAQLAYEKGMYVLTASQSYQSALETQQFGHGLLTYALVEEGLKTSAAETPPASGDLELREWLDYAARRVPELQQSPTSQSRRLEHETEQIASQSKTIASQQPRVFYRREPDAQPLIIARITATP